MHTVHDAKAMAKSARAALAEKNIDISHSEALEIVARQLGFQTWNVLSARLDKETASADEPRFTPPVPIVRIFDEARARDFYQGFLEFKVDWEHRFEPQMPLYMQVSRGAVVLHLSEHSGDANPGCNMVVNMTGIEAFQASLIAKKYKYMRPGLEKRDWGLECTVIDPFGNRIRFLEPSSQ